MIDILLIVCLVAWVVHSIREDRKESRLRKQRAFRAWLHSELPPPPPQIDWDEYEQKVEEKIRRGL